MIEVRELLEEKGIRSAVVIDDVFDPIPRPDELDDGDWSNFFDDLDSEGEETLKGHYDSYDKLSRDQLKASPEFVAVVWENRGNLSEVLQDHLFSDYVQTRELEERRLGDLVADLETLGLCCKQMGRDDDIGSSEPDLIFIDLFLGFRQTEDDMSAAIERVRMLVEERASNPPLVVLMSRSSRLQDMRNEFRDKAGLLGSTFRVISKGNLAKTGMLEMLLTRLASHYGDAKKVAQFVHAWDKGLDQAKIGFISILRRLDLPDLAQIRSLLLDFEGQMLGQYLLDVADRVLQHEIEAATETIDAAQQLNQIELTNYPTSHLAGSPDLQELVHRMIFQHACRRKLSFNGKTPAIQYGDVLQCRDKETGGLTDDVILVVTPACDLARGGVEHVLVLPGTLTSLAMEDWSYSPEVVKTPIFESEEKVRYCISWDLKGRKTVLLTKILKGLQNQKKYDRIGRMRETYTTEIQQRMLADMGRIGQPAKPPATFPVSLHLFVVPPQGSVRPVTVEGLEMAVCFIGRDADKNRVDHLVLGEAACDALKSKIQEITSEEVHQLARKSLCELQADLKFFERFERGSINVPIKDGNLQEEKGNNNLTYLHIYRNYWKNESVSVKGNYRNGPFMLKICDVGNQAESST